jgi:hypothetical protein
MDIMEMKYIFLRKMNDIKVENLESPFTLMFKTLFNNVTNNSFDIQINESFYIVKFNYAKNDIGNTYYLTITSCGTVAQCAKILNEVNKKLIKGPHRKEYNIILSFDSISHYYCNKIYPKFNLFERKIRELIFCILIKTFGIDWYDATFSEELKNELKQQGLKQSDLIERALYEMTIYQLENYLFEPYSISKFESILENELSTLAVRGMTKDEIIEVLDQCRAKSLWERFFEGKIKIDHLQSNLGVIRNYRNSVAHSKHFYKDDYQKCSLILNKLIRQIEIAIEEIEIKTFNLSNISESIGALLGIAIGTLLFKGIVNMIAPAIKAISKASKVSSNIPNIGKQIADQMNAMSDGSRVSSNIPNIGKQIAEQMKVMSEASRVSSNIPNIGKQIAEQMKAISEASRASLNIPNIANQIAEHRKAMSEPSKSNLNIPNIRKQITEHRKTMLEASKTSSSIPNIVKIDVSESMTDMQNEDREQNICGGINKRVVENDETVDNSEKNNENTLDIKKETI